MSTRSPTNDPAPPRRPEILAPAGSREALDAALAAGADAVYFGLDAGFNARARAENFALADLGATVAHIHRAGARAYLTVNTLMFEPEIEPVEAVLRAIARAGADAIIVQDPAVALLAREICPTLEIHASTQMTIADPDAARFALALGATRVVVPRELSVAEIRRFAAASPIELEVFIHGALCVSWSGQCLTSEAWGGRSANRGQCAQSCRMPYDLIVDGSPVDTGDVKYLLSPKDLAGLRAVPELIAIGVHGLKIEGRQKGAQYVATAVQGYRHRVDAVAEGRGGTPAAQATAAHDLRDMTLAYSRGFGDGFLAGADHQSLVEGRFPKHRGVYLGTVAAVHPDAVLVARARRGRPWTGALAAPVRRAPEGRPSAALEGLGGAADAATGPTAEPVEPRAGMGVVFDAGHPEDQHEPGGPIFFVDPHPAGWWLRFGNPGPDLTRVTTGQQVWITSDPTVVRAVSSLMRQDAASGRIAVALSVSGAAGQPLLVTARSGGHEVAARSESLLQTARSGGLAEPIIREKLGSFGGTPFHLAEIDATGLAAGLHLPVSELKAMRRTVCAQLEATVLGPPAVELSPPSAAERVRQATAAPPSRADAARDPELRVLCRSDEQLDAVIEAGLPSVELDWMELVGLGRAVARARSAGLRITLATLRVIKPGEEDFDLRLLKLEPDALLVRHFGALVRFADLRRAGARFGLEGDFSLNVTNSITAGHLLAAGLDAVTAAFDLDRTQLLSLLDHFPAERMAVVVHHRIPTFHTEHCLYAHVLSQGRDFHTCGRPCESHRVSVRDHLGREHPVIVDASCRNTVFNAEPQGAAALVPELLARGVRTFRIDLVRESLRETREIIAAWRALLAGAITPGEALRRAEARDQLGVASGAMTLIV